MCRKPEVALTFVLFVLILVLPGCTAKRVPDSGQPLATVSNLAGSESLVFDPARDVYFVSNVNGDPGVKDGNGFISRITADGVVDSLHFIQGGRGGVALSAPMGSRIQGDTLWVLDVDALRGFSAITGAPVATIDLTSVHPLFLNDVTLGPDGDFYVTDTGVGKTHTGPDRIYHIDRSRKVSVALESAALSMPDGIGWDANGRRLILAPFGGKAVQSWQRGQAMPTDLAPGASKFDGVEIQPNGEIVISSWNDSSVSTLDTDKLVRRIKLTMPPADISMDAKRKRIGIVSMMTDQFQLWAWPNR
ncbi:MAG TPA: SMP-30/gluconolactonase/LRE family protein [Gemmatimonadaceae bacterium]|nr:SMP-30/gluconolactonase/LRE family protein [Gemmatimonadaceae bacterium]